MESFGPNNQRSAKLLSYKLVGLLALTAPDRASGLAARDLRFRSNHPGVEFKLPELTKNVKQDESLKCCFHASCPENDLLCVCKCLAEYESRTLGWRPADLSKPNKLLLSYITYSTQTSYFGYGSEVVERTYAARWHWHTNWHHNHIQRAFYSWAVTTEAARQGFSIPDILQFADWSQQNTFIKFYYRPQFSPSAGRAVLLSNRQ